VCVLAATLLAIVALVARGYQPIAGDEPRREASTEFFDYLFTAAAVLWLLGGVLAFALWAGEGRRDQRRPRLRIGLPGALFIVAVVLLLAYGPDLFDRIRPGDDRPTETGATTRTGSGEAGAPRRREAPEFEWPLALAIGLGLLVGAGILGARRLRRRPDDATLARALANELDAGIDDLRRERDPRRAVIAAYARMEQLLGAHGVPRHPAEAPLEYLARVLLELEVGEQAVRKLTSLFEEAKFSDHELGSDRRDEAISALVDVRDSLRGDDE
jgi:hypothetical protein